MTNILVSCGCSFTSGFWYGGQFTPYGEIAAGSLGYTHINLASPGASNYFIAKQVEHAIDLNPAIVCIGVTTAFRFEFLQKLDSINGTVVYSDFNTYSNKDPAKIESKPIHVYLRESNNNVNNKIRRDNYRNMYEFYTKNLNYTIKQDADRLIILGAYLQLISKGIKCVLLDFSVTMGNYPEVIKLPYKDMASKFPCSDDNEHFNQEGHNYVANIIVDRIKFVS